MVPAEPDPRVERSRRLIGRATLAELAEVGYGAMTIESIAKRAGVGKATVYRHWTGKLDLVASALELAKEELAVPAEGTVRERVTALLESLADHLRDSTLASCMPALVSASQYDESVREFHHRYASARRQVLIDLLHDGIATGELPADLDAELTAETLVGPLFYCRLMTPLPRERVRDVVRLVLGDV
jgi:TetR/AcrR family transcriptional regulator of autoinduction and epiphytic fitness